MVRKPEISFKRSSRLTVEPGPRLRKRDLRFGNLRGSMALGDLVFIYLYTEKKHERSKFFFPIYKVLLDLTSFFNHSYFLLIFPSFFTEILPQDHRSLGPAYMFHL